MTNGSVQHAAAGPLSFCINSAKIRQLFNFTVTQKFQHRIIIVLFY